MTKLTGSTAREDSRADLGLWFWWPWRDAVFFALATVFIGVLTWRRGVALSPDGETYGQLADLLISLGWSYGALWKSVSLSFPVELYTGIITLVAVCKTLFGSAWPQAIGVLNVLALSGVAVLSSRLSWRLTRSRGASLFAFALVLPCFEMWNWARLVLSDPTFLFLVVLLLFVECSLLLSAQQAEQALPRPKYLGKDTSKYLGWIVSGLGCVSATFYRPTGMLLWLPWILAAWMWRRAQKGKRMAPRPLVALGCAALISVGAIVGHSWLMEKPERWPLKAFRLTMTVNAQHYRLGEIVWDRRETWHRPPQRTRDFVLIALDRARFFAAPMFPAFSHGHNALNALFFGPTYFFSLLGLLSLVRGSPFWSDEQRACLWILWAGLWEVWLFHALVQVDYDWRYRLPVLPMLMVLAASGAAWAFRNRKAPAST